MRGTSFVSPLTRGEIESGLRTEKTSAIVHFYNTRDVEEWPLPEVAENVNTDELGDLRLTPDEEAAFVDLLKTLSDG